MRFAVQNTCRANVSPPLVLGQRKYHWDVTGRSLVKSQNWERQSLVRIPSDPAHCGNRHQWNLDALGQNQGRIQDPCRFCPIRANRALPYHGSPLLRVIPFLPPVSLCFYASMTLCVCFCGGVCVCERENSRFCSWLCPSLAATPSIPPTVVVHHQLRCSGSTHLFCKPVEGVC